MTEILGPKGVIQDPAEIAPHLSEWRGRWKGRADVMAAPASTAEAAALVALCHAAGVAITPQGGNTGLVGGQIPDGELLVSMRRMNRIRSVSAQDDALVAEAGVVLAAAQEVAAGADRLFPLRLASEGTATIGGLISTNAGGVHVVRYGMMRDLVLGIEAVLPDGRVLDALKSLRKDNTGYDLKQLFIGAEGTLGLVTAASLKLFPRPAERVVAMAAVSGPEAALALMLRAKETGALAAFEIMNRTGLAMTFTNIEGARDPLPGADAWLALIELEAARAGALRAIAEDMLAGALDAGLAGDVVIAENETQARAFWRVRESMSAGHRGEGVQTNMDIAAPVARVPEFLARGEEAVRRIAPQARVVAFGHAGDGNMHFTVIAPARGEDAAFRALLPAITEAAQDVAVGLGGSISAEHGIGVARRGELARYKSREALDVMAAVKAALDPRRIMNPRALT
ncbi:MAG: FAD-binding oxidoreductase [Hyphomonadaceae bacterium]